MVIILHILIAFISIFYTGYTYLFPSVRKLFASYCLVFATLISGSYLLIIRPTHMAQTCITGLIYLGFVTIGITKAHKKLAKIISN